VIVTIVTSITGVMMVIVVTVIVYWQGRGREGIEQHPVRHRDDGDGRDSDSPTAACRVEGIDPLR
jgi:hypothetical protein